MGDHNRRGNAPPDVEIGRTALLALSRQAPGVDSMKESNANSKSTPVRPLPVTPRMEEAWQAVDACFGRFCLTAGIEAL